MKLRYLKNYEQHNNYLNEKIALNKEEIKSKRDEITSKIADIENRLYQNDNSDNSNNSNNYNNYNNSDKYDEVNNSELSSELSSEEQNTNNEITDDERVELESQLENYTKELENIKLID